MNSSLQKALLASVLAVGGAMHAVGQGFDYDPVCIDPNNTAPYSTDFGTMYLETPLWSAGLGVSGTVAYGKNQGCLPIGGGNVNVAGRFTFAPGPIGSYQDDLRIGAGKTDVSPDNYEDFQYGANHFGGAMSGSDWSYARIYAKTGTNTTSGLFGAGIYTFYSGASNRYMFAEQTDGTTNTDARLVIDVLGDTARFSWHITNIGTTTESVGLWLGQWVVPRGGYSSTPPTPVDNYGVEEGDSLGQPYVQVPGLKPRIVEQRFIRANDPTNFPAWCNFSGSIPTVSAPNLGGGMQVVNTPYQNVADENGNSDQTPVDEFVIGDLFNLLDGFGNVATPVFKDIILPDVYHGGNGYGIAFAGTSFIQKWQPNVSLGPNQSRDIISYYRSVWGDSNYANGYTAVVDTPKVISASKADPHVFDPNPFTIRVDVDNTGGFGQVYTALNMNNVAVTLKLPQGMHDPNNPALTTITQYIASVPYQTIASTDFQVAVDSNVFGSLPYTVVITPQPGSVKTINGIIKVAATPLLQVTQGANLVTSPWSYNDPTWQTILAPLTPITDYQTYTWDPAQQAYVIQTGPQRGIGTWIVSNTTHGFVSLNGNPVQPNDELPPANGAPNIQLQPGWNLVGNPYNYSFPLGQLVGVPAGTTTALTYDQLVTGNYFDGSFAYYDSGNQNYSFLQGNTAELLPNYGYWIYCTSAITLSFPPIYDLFVRTPIKQVDTNQLFNHYRLQLSAAGTVGKDTNAFVGLDATAAPNLRNARKEPVSPSNKAIRAFVTSQGFIPGLSVGTGQLGHNIIPGLPQGSGSNITNGQEYAQMVHNTVGKQVFNYNVYSAGETPVTVTWPNLGTLPKNLAVSIEDLSTRRTINARTTSSDTYYATANSIKTYQVTITPQGTVRQTVSNVSEQVRNTGGTKQMKISFSTTTSGEATLTVYQNGKQVATVIQNMGVVAGVNSVVWPMSLSNGQVVHPGTYVLQISALGEGGDIGTKLVTLNL